VVELPDWSSAFTFYFVNLNSITIIAMTEAKTVKAQTPLVRFVVDLHTTNSQLFDKSTTNPQLFEKSTTLSQHLDMSRCCGFVVNSTAIPQQIETVGYGFRLVHNKSKSCTTNPQHIYNFTTNPQQIHNKSNKWNLSLTVAVITRALALRNNFRILAECFCVQAVTSRISAEIVNFCVNSVNPDIRRKLCSAS
jgi:hypothetical protein